MWAVRGIRGAIGVPENSRDAILAATRRLLLALQDANSFDCHDLASITFTATPDLNAAFPAEAARQLGWTSIPLLSATEIAVPGAMPRVVRVLALWNTNVPQQAVKHLYLDGAEQLRPDLSVYQEQEPIDD